MDHFPLLLFWLIEIYRRMLFFNEHEHPLCFMRCITSLLKRKPACRFPVGWFMKIAQYPCSTNRTLDKAAAAGYWH